MSYDQADLDTTPGENNGSGSKIILRDISEVQRLGQSEVLAEYPSEGDVVGDDVDGGTTCSERWYP